jgi:RNA polymerase sigma-70 factor, ECF subfamily
MAHLSVIHDLGRADTGEAAEVERLQGVACGDREALAWLYRRYHRRLARFLARLTRRSDVIDETINDVFCIVWQRADRFRGEARVSTWIMGIAYRAALKTLRQHGSETAEESPESAHARDDPFALHELVDWVDKAMRRLAPEQRIALELAYGGGHSLEEIAGIMDCPVSTVKARMFHARVKLRHLLPTLAGHAEAEPAPSAPDHDDGPTA